MDPAMTLGIIGIIWLVVYFVGQAIGTEKLQNRGFDISFPFFFMYRTERLNAWLTRWGKRFPRVFFNVGVVVGFLGMAFSFWIFGENLIKFFVQPEAAGGVVPIIPGITISGLPLVYMVIALTVTLLVHEFAHGFAASRDDITIKSSGLLAFFVLGGAFVEPDEDAFEKEATPQARMRMLAAGSFSNMIWAFVFVLMLLNFTAMMSIAYNPPSGAYIYQLSEGSPAASALEVGDVIVGLNDTTISNWTALSQFMADAPAGANLTIHTIDGSVNITLASSELNASRGYIGVYGTDYWEPKPGWDLLFTPMFVFHLYQIVFWCYLINISLALFNLLPIPVLDGDKMLLNALRLKISDEKKIMYIMWPIRIVAILIVVLSIVFSLLLGKGLF
ncbi:MAG: site-2 protease family protein [Candidatus Thorarchaeota archaeon]